MAVMRGAAGEVSRPINAAAAAAATKSAAATAASAAAAKQAALTAAQGTVVSDLNSGNYNGAWQAAIGLNSQYGLSANSATANPLVAQLESNTGLQALDPTKKWTQADVNNYYSAFGNDAGYSGGTVVGDNPYGDWGSQAAVLNGTDAKTDYTTDAGGAPDVERFAGAKPTQSFLSKYGGDLAMVAAAVVAPEALPAISGALGIGSVAAGALYGAGTSAAIGAATGKPITLGSVAGGAIGGALGGGLLNGAGNAISGATGLGQTASTALAGAGVGAARSALTGGNIGVGALTGGIGGAIQGSGIGQQAVSGLNSAGLPNWASNAIVQGGIGAGTGALGGALTGGNIGQDALIGGGAGAVSGAVSGLAGPGILSNAAGTIAGGLISKYTAPAAPAQPTPAAPAAAPATPAAPVNTGPAFAPPALFAPTGAYGASLPTPTTGAAPANIGAYSGYTAGLGYQPQSQVDPNISNYNTYGQGPEAKFYAPTPGT